MTTNVSNASINQIVADNYTHGLCSNECLINAAKTGRLDVYKYYMQKRKNCHMKSIKTALENGHHHIVEYVVQNKFLKFEIKNQCDIFSYVMRQKHYNTAVYLIKLFEKDPQEKISLWYTFTKNLSEEYSEGLNNVIKAFKLGEDVLSLSVYSHSLLENASKVGNTEIIKIYIDCLKDMNCVSVKRCIKKVISNLLKTDNIDTLEYLLDKNIIFIGKLKKYLEDNAKLSFKAIKWCERYNIPYSLNVCECTVEVVKYLHFTKGKDFTNELSKKHTAPVKPSTIIYLLQNFTHEINEYLIDYLKYDNKRIVNEVLRYFINRKDSYNSTIKIYLEDILQIVINNSNPDEDTLILISDISCDSAIILEIICKNYLNTEESFIRAINIFCSKISPIIYQITEEIIKKNYIQALKHVSSLYGLTKNTLLLVIDEHRNNNRCEMIDFVLTQGVNLEEILKEESSKVFRLKHLNYLIKKKERIYKGKLDERTETHCGICQEEMKTDSPEQVLQCQQCKKCTHDKCQSAWGDNCIFCRSTVTN